MKKLLQMGLCGLCCVAFICGCDNSDTVINEDGNNPGNSEKENQYALDKTFEFDDLEITISSDFSFTKIENQYSDYNEQEVIKIPVTVKNLKDETHSLNMFYYSFYGSQGAQLSTVSTYFYDEDSVDYAGDLRTGASYTKYFYALYDGDGTYTIEFNDFTQKISIDFEVTK